MAVCGVAGLVLFIGALFLRKRAVFKTLRGSFLLLFLFCAVGFVAALIERVSSDGAPLSEIERREPGEGEFETEVYVFVGQEEEKIPLTLIVGERERLREEEESLLAAAVLEIDETFCAKNASLDEIVTDPAVFETYQDGAVFAEWMFSDGDVISPDGTLLKTAGKRGSRKVEAYVNLSCGESEKRHRFTFRIAPKEESREEKLAADILEKIDGQDKTEAVVRLPETVDGRKLTWSFEGGVRPEAFLGLGILSAAAAAYAAKETEEKKRRKRKRRLLLSYPEFVSKLSLLLGAGMTISGALQKMNRLYQDRRARSGRKEEVYEELFRMICEIDNGAGELRAYQTFAESCDLQPYRKLVSLLVSGQRIGNRRLAAQLNEEADRVFLERKNAARRLGEEAGTKLLLPMMLMLVIVMGVVMIPAFLSLY